MSLWPVRPKTSGGLVGPSDPVVPTSGWSAKCVPPLRRGQNSRRRCVYLQPSWSDVDMQLPHQRMRRAPRPALEARTKGGALGGKASGDHAPAPRAPSGSPPSPPFPPARPPSVGSHPLSPHRSPPRSSPPARAGGGARLAPPSPPLLSPRPSLLPRRSRSRPSAFLPAGCRRSTPIHACRVASFSPLSRFCARRCDAHVATRCGRWTAAGRVGARGEGRRTGAPQKFFLYASVRLQSAPRCHRAPLGRRSTSQDARALALASASRPRPAPVSARSPARHPSLTAPASSRPPVPPHHVPNTKHLPRPSPPPAPSPPRPPPAPSPPPRLVLRPPSPPLAFLHSPGGWPRCLNYRGDHPTQRFTIPLTPAQPPRSDGDVLIAGEFVR